MPRNRSEKRTPEDEYFLGYMRAWVDEMWRKDGLHVGVYPDDSRTLQMLRDMPRGMNRRLQILKPKDRKAWLDAQE